MVVSSAPGNAVIVQAKSVAGQDGGRDRPFFVSVSRACRRLVVAVWPGRFDGALGPEAKG